MLCPRNFLTSKIPSETYHLQREAKQRAGVELIPSQQIIPEEKKNPFEEQKRDHQIPPQRLPGDDRITSEEQEGDDRIPSQIIADDENIPYDDKEGHYRIRP